VIDVRFCNYNRDYQQRLGFLKVVSRVGHGARGGPNDILQRVESLYPESRRPPLAGRKVENFDPKTLIRDLRVPSWIVGFVPKTLDRLVSWAEMVGLVAQSGRLSEWATILDGARECKVGADWFEDNPFVLTPEERAFFVQLLFFHDQVLPLLVRRLGERDGDEEIHVAESCVLVTHSIGDLLEQTKNNSPIELQTRLELRDLLERIGQQYKIDDPRKLVNTATRHDVLRSLEADRLKGVRVRLAEFHAICRFEQLTDMGLLTKEDPRHPPGDETSREKAKCSWSWYVTPQLRRAAAFVPQSVHQLEDFLRDSWMHFCTAGASQELPVLDAFIDQKQIAAILDETLPLARRQIGPVQLHTWAGLTCLHALGRGAVLEQRTIETLLDAMRIDPHTSDSVRLSGRAELRGRTAAIPRTGLLELLNEHTVNVGGTDVEK
jgi:hypothetical protein